MDALLKDSLIKNCRMEKLVVRHSFRQGNEAAHLLAKEASNASSINNLSHLVVPPPFVTIKMLADKDGVPFIKFVSLNAGRQLAKLGKLNAMNGLSLQCNAPMFSFIIFI